MENKSYPFSFIQQLVNYLATKPYQETFQFIDVLVGKVPFEVPKEEPKEEEKEEANK